MKLGIYDINDYLDYKTRLSIYKEVGFEEIALYLDENYMQQGETATDIIQYARELGLIVKQVHLDYKISNLICDENSDEFFEYLEQKLKECVVLNIPLAVMHASKGDTPPIPSNRQIEKLKKIAAAYPQVTLCFENVRNNYNLDQILQSKPNSIKVCFDLGHAHAYGDENLLFKKYKDFIACTHLHNNYGKDSHNILNDGDIDYKYFLNKLKDTASISNCLECFPPRNSINTKQEFYNFVKKCADFQ